MTPRISVVIPCLNQERFIEETLASIVSQEWPDLELIVIDGGSTDATLRIIETYAPHISYRVSEPDRGQAEAINKGLRRASGDIVTWFNADDVYADGIFTAVAEAWQRTPRAIYAAPVANFQERGRETLIHPRGLTFENVVQYWKECSLWHDPGLFWSRAVIDQIGDVDASLRYAFDYDYLARALQRFPVEYVERVAAGFRLHGDSKTVSQNDQMMIETAAVSRRYWALVKELDERGFERAELDADVRRALSKIVRRRETSPLWGLIRRRPATVLLRLTRMVPSMLRSRFRRQRPARYF